MAKKAKPAGDHVVRDPVLRVLYERRVELNQKLRLLQTEIERVALNAINEWRVMECRLPGLKGSYDDVVVSDEECKHGPLGVCVYNHGADPNHQACLVCGFPEDRE